ncbi:MAG TPA: hypothetical protein VIL03_05530, partial [Clostridia bacterium]
MRNLLIDIGSTNIKWAVNQNDEIFEVFKTSFPPKKQLPAPFYEVELNKITDIISDIINSQQDINNIFISTQMHGYV